MHDAFGRSNGCHAQKNVNRTSYCFARFAGLLQCIGNNALRFYSGYSNQIERDDIQFLLLAAASVAHFAEDWCGRRDSPALPCEKRILSLLCILITN